MRRRLGPLAILVGGMLAGMLAPVQADTLHKPDCSGSICWVGNKNNSFTPPDTAQVDVFSSNESLAAIFVALVYEMDGSGNWTVVAQSIGPPKPVVEGDFASGFQIGYGRRASWNAVGVACRNAVWLVWATNPDGSLALPPRTSDFC